uniref:Protein phosphatase 1 regulatory subunit 7 n=1 Tax=Palpitomonas bilix TaxID=652834 RepID=A0A7S3DEG1_9EUKA|mmetsp:Transcript_3422/g.6749  ORF Transcript_3422/g.6749 Transcript_3422/m.6749 type:complete len:367 (+) Transcript_3422:103-1203(+)
MEHFKHSEEEVKEEDVVDESYTPKYTIPTDLPSTLVELHLTSTRISNIEHLEHLTRLKKLVLRQNTITALDGLSSLTTLEYLDVYDNKLTTLEPLEKMSKLAYLDMSFNNLKDHLSPISYLTSLSELYLIHNHIHTKGVEAVDWKALARLSILELGDNKIRQISALSSLHSTLTSLWLGKNKIEKVEGISHLQGLQRLSIQNNRLTSFAGVEGLTNLEELYLSHNGAKAADGVESLTALTTLDLSHNFIASLLPLSTLKNLDEVWASFNPFESTDVLQPLKHLPKVWVLTCCSGQLSHVYSVDCPVFGRKPFANRSRQRQAWLPSVCSIVAARFILHRRRSSHRWRTRHGPKRRPIAAAMTRPAHL